MSTTTGIDRKVLIRELEAKQAEADRIASTFAHEDGKFVITEEKHRAFTNTVKEVEQLKGVLAGIDSITETKQWLNSSPDGSEAGRDAGIPRQRATGDESLGDMFIESKAYKAARERGFGESVPNIQTVVEGKSIFNYSAGTATVQALGSAQHLGIAELQRRKMHVRDLFPKSTTRAAVLYGVRETGWVNNARQVKQRYAADGVSPATGGLTDVFGRAPKSRIQLTNVLYPIAEIKHALDAHHAILDDEPRLKTFLNTRMLEGVKFAEDYDLLHSVGDGDRLNGIFNTPGVQDYTGLSSDKYSVQIRRAITKALLAEYDPTGVVISPTRWEEVETEEDDQGGFRVAVSVAIGAQKTVWRLQVVETTAMVDEQFLIGAFGMGSQLHDRETVKVQVSTEHDQNFTDGVVTFLASERVALEVPRPESFVIGTWTTPA